MFASEMRRGELPETSGPIRKGAFLCDVVTSNTVTPVTVHGTVTDPTSY